MASPQSQLRIAESLGLGAVSAIVEAKHAFDAGMPERMMLAWPR
jgi:hypothetical protein